MNLTRHTRITGNSHFLKKTFATQERRTQLLQSPFYGPQDEYQSPSLSHRYYLDTHFLRNITCKRRVIIKSSNPTFCLNQPFLFDILKNSRTKNSKLDQKTPCLSRICKRICLNLLIYIY